AEMAASERLAHDPETMEQREGRAPLRLDGRQRRSLFGGLLLIQLMAVVVLAIAAMPLGQAVVDVAHEEVMRPGLGGNIYVRVLDGVREPFFVLLAGLVLVEMVAALATRRLLAARFGLSAAGARYVALPWAVAAAVGGALLRPLQSPLRTLGSLALVWLASLVVLLPAVWAIQIAWDAVRSTYLAAGLLAAPQGVVGLIVVTLALAAMWVIGLLLAGFAAAVRAAIWSTQALH
ncbi:MAG: hypothetical protein M3253_02290, partial [Chloroflexota bacterium]|nr:hypothetical protein [Chloroflexota bacterium]